MKEVYIGNCMNLRYKWLVEFVVPLVRYNYWL